MKKIVFLTGTRADFGKLKSLITITQNSKFFESYIFVTGMHLNELFGYTVDEIEKSGFKNIYKHINHLNDERMDISLSKTIEGFSKYVALIKPDLVVVHGDRVEALAGAIVGSLNNILVAHIEGGEISGTIDELIRHSVSKMSHIHLVSNSEAKKRLIQLGEIKDSIYVIGSPDLDLMHVDFLPKLSFVKDYYDITFDNFSIAMFHPVTTEFEKISEYARNFCKSLIESDDNFILVYPNNDLGSLKIIKEIGELENLKKIKIYPSLRFEYFLTLLSKSDYIIGNSSAGIREAPYYNIPTVDIGSRQFRRANLNSIFNSNYSVNSIIKAIKKAKSYKNKNVSNNLTHFGLGKSDKLFLRLLRTEKLWKTNKQKQFQDLD
ncbi:MAG: UDP-N-acetylglucosamine 2-epimerase (hydrolyzing) [Candidatus Marinimicrobia bacterium]|nr:UDP-N-acetylglucosamine 2-epimerase (hydrolyzing) [Candidatus Neomarinimicrobiota bacterium]